MKIRDDANFILSGDPHQLRVIICLKDQIEQTNEFKDGRLEYLDLDHYGDAKNRFKFSHNINSPIPEIVVKFVDEVIWKSFSINGKPPKREGVHTYKNGEVVITIDRKDTTDSFLGFLFGEIGSYNVKISAKNISSFLEIFANLFPKLMFREFSA